MKKMYFQFFCFIVLPMITLAQKPPNDSIRYDLNKLYSYCLDVDVKSALVYVESVDPEKLSAKSKKVKAIFEERFKYDNDKSSYLNDKSSGIDDLLSMYHSYWRESLLNPDKNFDTIFRNQVAIFLSLKLKHPLSELISDDSINVYEKKYIESKGLHTTGFGRTGKLYDLLVWKTQNDTTYITDFHNEKISSRVYMMDDFVILGWMEYATFDLYYPSGWATREALYCVKKSYDLNSEDFLISYLAHEGRHFSDFKLFPKLSNADLEYRAKLTELSLLKTTLYDTIEFFINNSNFNSDNSHSVANYCAIRDLSIKVFGVEYEKDIAKWKSVKMKKINAKSYGLLKSNTKALKLKGTAVEKFIKP